MEKTKKNLQQGRGESWPVGDPDLRLSHWENPRDYPPRYILSTYMVSFLSLTGLHFILTFLPACETTLSWLAILKTRPRSSTKTTSPLLSEQLRSQAAWPAFCTTHIELQSHPDIAVALPISSAYSEIAEARTATSRQTFRFIFSFSPRRELHRARV